jgi:hypothetical protein
MKIDKQNIINKLCYTELVYHRINKKLDTQLSKEQIEQFILEVLKETEISSFIQRGKNYYITNSKNEIRITINSNTFRVITVDKI